MNDTLLIAMPTWFYWLLVAWLVLDAVRITLNIFNQFLAWRIEKRRT